MAEKSKSQYLDILQIFRGVAAVMVVIHHAAGSLKYYHHVESGVLDFVGGLGKLGVDFFFVLSGFIISYSSYFKFTEPHAFKHYVINRVLRIYVPYLPIGIALLVLYSQFPSLSSVDRSISTLTTLTLFPDGNPALSVAWTLSFEMLFYLLFSLCFFSKKAWNYLLVVWLSAILFINYFWVSDYDFGANPILRVVFSAYNLEFLVGYFLSLVVIKKVKINYAMLLSCIGVVAVVFLSCFYFKVKLFDFMLNMLFSILVFGIILFFITFYNVPIRKQALLMVVGNATYSIYLVHNPLQATLIKMMPKISNGFYTLFLILLTVFCSCLIGYIYYRVFEVYVLNKMKSYLIKK